MTSRLGDRRGSCLRKSLFPRPSWRSLLEEDGAGEGDPGPPVLTTFGDTLADIDRLSILDLTDPGVEYRYPPPSSQPLSSLT